MGEEGVFTAFGRKIIFKFDVVGDAACSEVLLVDLAVARLEVAVAIIEVAVERLEVAVERLEVAVERLEVAAE